jgi:hypothetical protein
MSGPLISASDVKHITRKGLTSAEGRIPSPGEKETRSIKIALKANKTETATPSISWWILGRNQILLTRSVPIGERSADHVTLHVSPRGYAQRLDPSPPSWALTRACSAAMTAAWVDRPCSAAMA